MGKRGAFKAGVLSGCSARPRGKKRLEEKENARIFEGYIVGFEGKLKRKLFGLERREGVAVRVFFARPAARRVARKDDRPRRAERSARAHKLKSSAF